jgi:hypothetical protein
MSCQEKGIVHGSACLCSKLGLLFCGVSSLQFFIEQWKFSETWADTNLPPGPSWAAAQPYLLLDAATHIFVFDGEPGVLVKLDVGPHVDNFLSNVRLLQIC